MSATLQEAILGTIAANAVAATLLALIAAAVGTRWRNPGVLHVLWLLVLAKMLVPPAMELRLLPAGIAERLIPGVRPEASVTAPAAAPAQLAAPVEPGPPAPLEAARFASAPDLRAGILAAISLGAAAVLGLALARAVRFRRLLRDARPAPDSLARRAGAIAAAMGLRRAPRIRLVDARIPPVLWPGPPCEILLPAALADALTGDELDAMLAHELGHVRRRDHWTRGVELLAVAAFWWHPVVWWARRNLRAAEESCCDALVVRSLGDRPRAYADALLKTLEFLARAPHRPVPALATGAGDFHRLKERLTMIVSRSTARPLSPWKHRAVLGAALAALAVGPSWTGAAVAQGESPPPAPRPPAGAPPVGSPPGHPVAAAPEAPAPPPGAPFAPDPEMLAALEKLQRESERLEQQMLDLEREQALLQLRMEELEVARHALDLEEAAERMRSEGHAGQAELIRQQAELLQERVDLRRVEIDREHERNVNRLEMDAKLRTLEMLRAAEEMKAAQRAMPTPDAD